MKIILAFSLVLATNAAHAWMQVYPTSVTFYSVPIDNVFGEEKSVRVTNTGPNAVSLNMYDTCSFDFNIRETFCWSLAPQQSCTIDIRFKPSRVGTQSCTLRISDTMGGSATVWIRGDGTAIR